jgi:hypothetical protein
VVHVAVITMTRNEARMLPRWVEYYGGAVGERNLYVLDDSSDDGSTQGLAATVITMPVRATEEPGRVFGAYKAALASKLAVALLDMYDVVVFTDADEFIVADPRSYSGLADYLARHPDAPVLAPVGVNLLHLPAQEPPLRDGVPLLAQRRHVKVVGGMCKPAIKRVRARWSGGTHGVKAPYAISRDLYLVHAKYADREAALATQADRHREYRATDAGRTATWTIEPTELDATWSRWTASDAPAPVLDFESVDLEGVVREEDNGIHRSFGPQATAMLGPLYRLPDYLTTQV